MGPASPRRGSRSPAPRRDAGSASSAIPASASATRCSSVEETPYGAGCGNPPTGSWDANAWIAFWKWLLCLYGIKASAQALAVGSVVSREDELGTTLVEFDRDLESVLSSQTKPYAAYRILATAGQARHLERVLRVTESAATPTDVSGLYSQASAIDGASIVLDAELDGLSKGQTVAIVDWTSVEL